MNASTAGNRSEQTGQASQSAQVNWGVTGAGIALLAAIVIGSFVAAGWFSGTGTFVSQNNPVVFVHDSNGRVHSLPLLENGQVTVSTDLGTNVITVEDGQAFISESDCDGHDCIRQGRISSPGKQLICLPHQLWVEVRTDTSVGTMDVDAAANDGGHASEHADEHASEHTEGHTSEHIGGHAGEHADGQGNEFDNVDTSSR